MVIFLTEFNVFISFFHYRHPGACRDPVFSMLWMPAFAGMTNKSESSQRHFFVSHSG
jgi:hypothetical protein